MTRKTALAHGFEPATPARFDSTKWLCYFQENRKGQSALRLPEKIELPDSVRMPLIRSLQRFQIGETGDGIHLKKFACRLPDPQYLHCVDLFVKEEQVHGQILAELILAMDGTLITWHWSDLAFIFLRHLFGLKTEIFIILIAEIVGKCFYRELSDRIDNELMSNAMAIIVCDEIGHLRFHCEFLEQQMLNYPLILKKAIYLSWKLIFLAALLVFVMDHRPALAAMGLSCREFFHVCLKEFERAAFLSFAKSLPAVRSPLGL